MTHDAESNADVWIVEVAGEETGRGPSIEAACLAAEREDEFIDWDHAVLKKIGPPGAIIL